MAGKTGRVSGRIKRAITSSLILFAVAGVLAASNAYVQNRDRTLATGPQSEDQHRFFAEGVDRPDITVFFKKLKPELVTPAVLFLASENAPTGLIIEAGAGHYSKVAILEAKGVKLGDNVTPEDIEANLAKITDMSGADEFTMGGAASMKIFSS